MKKALLLSVAALAALILLSAIGCGSGKLQTVEGEIIALNQPSEEELATDGNQLITLVALYTDEDEPYYLAMYGHNSELEVGQRIEVTFDESKTVIELGVMVRLKDEDGSIVDSEYRDNVKFKEIISYKILAN